MSGWLEDIPNNASLKYRIKFYLEYSYYRGYDLERYFTEKNQIMMFEKLLKCDEEFKQQWESGSYCQPVDPAHTIMLADYETIKSDAKKFYRQICGYKINNKLTEGAKNLLKGYMIKYSQNYHVSVDDRLSQIFCGILRQENERRTSQLVERVREPGLTRLIRSYEGKNEVKNGGKKSKRRFKRKNLVKKTRKN